MATQLKIRPWQFEHQEQRPVLEQLERVSRERGHFRDILDASLQEEVATVGALQLSESDDEQEEVNGHVVEDEGPIHPTTREELYKAKFEMLQKVSMAHNEAMMALDFISLLESKDNAAGKQTMSQFLKDNVPAGTLGADVWQRMPKDNERDNTDARLAFNVRLDVLQKSADSILGAAKVLEDNVKKETRYWSEILTVTEGGWNVCRLPGQRQKLAVRFGLSEGSPEFNRGGIAALTADEDGAVSLDRDVATRSRAVRVHIIRDQEVIGSSTSTSVIDGAEASLETRIKHARDALFDEELFRELEREARTMVSSGVQMKGNDVTFALPLDSSPFTVRFELVAQHEALSTRHTKGPMDSLAHGILCTAKLLLCQAHRDQLSRRSAIPPPLSNAGKERPLLQILRPLLALQAHQHSLETINSHLDMLAKVLDSAGAEAKALPARMYESLPYDVQSIEALMHNILTSRVSEAILELQLPPLSTSASIKIRIETAVVPRCTSIFTLTSERSRTLHARSTQQLVWQLNRSLTALLARSLASTTEEEWFVDEDGAHLYRDGAPGTASNEVQVVIDEQSKAVRLSSASFDRQWPSDDEARPSIWETWKEMA